MDKSIIVWNNTTKKCSYDPSPFVFFDPMQEWTLEIPDLYINIVKMNMGSAKICYK